MRIVLLLLITLVGWATAQTSGQLSLVQNGFRHVTLTSGRLEVYYSGQWGTVCNDLWDLTNTRVACRELGYFGSNTSWTTSSAGGFGSATGPIWLDNINCLGTESRLTFCSKSAVGVNNCDHSQDVAITCSCNSTQFRCASGECIPDFTRCTGIRTCSDGSDEMNCISCLSGAFRCTNGHCISFSDHCDGTRDCTDGSDETGCSTPSSGDLRLVQNGHTSSSYTSGRLEIYYSGEWGTVCNHYWSATNTRVACRQLGFAGAASSNSYHTSYAAGFGTGSGRIWLDNVRCRGTESRLTSCPRNSYGAHNCYHSEDVAIYCSTGITTSSSGTSTPPTSASAVGTAIGASLASLVLLVIIPIIICIVICRCVLPKLRHTQDAYPTAGTDVKKAPHPAYEMSTYPPQPAYPYPPQEVYPPPPEAAYPYPPQEVYPPPPQAAYPYPPQDAYPPPPEAAYPYPPQEHTLNSPPQNAYPQQY